VGFRYGRFAMKKLILRSLLVLVILFVLVLAGTFLFLGTIVKAGVEKVGPRVAKVPVKLDSAKISVFSGEGELKGFVLGNPEGYKSPDAIKVGTVSMGIAPGSLLSEKKHVRFIRIDGPEIVYEADLKGGNLKKILDNLDSSAEQDKKAPTKDQQTSKTKLQVDEVVMTGAKVHFGATMVTSEQTIPLPEIRLKDLGQGPEGITPAELGQKILGLVWVEITKAVANNPGKITETLKSLGTGSGNTGTNLLQKATGLGDLLKKRE
jgi:hypothetical protein